jgi:hypothetical protein
MRCSTITPDYRKRPVGKELSTLPIRYRAAFTGGIALTLVLAGSLYLLFRDGDESERVPSSASVIDEIGGTYRGVGIGDSPADVRRVFGARDYADTSEGLMPVGAPLRHIWFGQDPIGSITMATTPFDGYER